ncbi:MAG: type II secretion system protein GspN [Deltaproteobacteria bacterium]|nr:type II secretion system protein GspN [Deltaproteobacteria bacterium]
MSRFLFVAVLCACASKDSATPAPGSASASAKVAAPADHQLHRTDTPGRVQITGTAVPLATQPTLEWLGLPMSGNVDVSIDVQHLDEPSKASGVIRIDCLAGCRLGDDKTTLKPATKNPRTAAFAGEMYFGHIDFDRISIAVDIKDGKGTVTGFDVASKDVTMKLTGTLELGKVAADAQLDLCLRFAATPALEARDPKTYALVQMSGAPRASDGMFNIKLAGTLGAVKRLGVVCDGSAPPETGMAPDVPATEPPAATSNDLDPALAKRIAAAIKKTSDTTYTIDRKVWETLFENPSAIARGARVVPAMKDGKPAGFKIYAIRPDSLYAQLGLTNGDTVVSLAGQSIVSIDKALEVYTKLRDTKDEPIVVVLERKSARVTLTYTVVE